MAHGGCKREGAARRRGCGPTPWSSVTPRRAAAARSRTRSWPTSCPTATTSRSSSPTRTARTSSSSHLVPREGRRTIPDRLRRQIDRFTDDNPPEPGQATGRVAAAPPHHLLRQVGAAQSRLYLLPLRAAPRHHGLHRHWDTSPSARRSRTNRTACGSVWRRRRRTSWERLRRRCWGGSSTCVQPARRSGRRSRR